MIRVRKLSPAEEGIFLQEKISGGSSHGVSLSVTFADTPPVEHLRSALLDVMTSHAALRTVVEIRDGRMWARVHGADETFHFEEVNVGADHGKEIEVARRWTIEAYGERCWNLQAEPPVRHHLLRHGDNRSTLVAAVHHIGFDGRSKFLYANQFMRALGLPSVPPEKLLSKTRDAVSPAEADEALVLAERYWRGMQVEHLPEVYLPSAAEAGRRPVTSTGQFEISGLERLRATSRECRTTVLGTLLTGLGVMLLGYGNRLPVVNVAVDVSKRTNVSDIGLAVNIVPVALAIEPGMTARGALRTTGNALRFLERTRDVPFHLMFRQLRLAPQEQGVFSAMAVSYIWIPVLLPEDTWRASGILWDFYAPNFGAPYICAWQFRRQETKILGRMDYRYDRIGNAGAAVMVRDLCQILKNLAADPDITVRQVLHDTMPGSPESRVPMSARGLSNQVKPRVKMSATSPIETLIIEAWADALECDSISPEAEFLDVGGDSMAAALIAETLTEELGVQVRPRDIYEQATVVSLGNELQRRMLEVVGRRANATVPRESGPTRADKR